MRAITLNRITIVLAFIGIFIAGTLSLGKFWNAVPPCGSSSSGCLKVETDPSSTWGPIPVAYVGLLAYVALAALAIVRQRKGLAPMRMLVNAGYAISAVGLMTSAFLTYYAISVIGATCLWCLSSAVTMIALFVVHAMLAQEDLPAEPVSSSVDFKFLTGTAAITVLALGIMGFQLHKDMRVVEVGGNTYKKYGYDKYVPQGAHAEGQVNAEVTVVEFGDLFCPACRANYSAIHNTIESSNGKIRFVFRHMPMHNIPGHEFAFSAAILSEIAAEKGKFWEFVNAAYAIQDEPKDLKPFLGVLSNLGISDDKLGDRLVDEKDPAFKKVYSDLQFAESTGVQGTPSFFLLRTGQEPEAKTASGLKDWLQSPEASKYIPKQ